MNLEQLEKIRRFELDAIITEIGREVPKRARLLEFGAGTGWQAEAMTKEGYAVEAIDMPTSSYADNRVFPIQDYDGHKIPFDDDSFDAIYSSNVLEHIAHRDAFQHELLRVLKPGGVVVHVVPSGSWRFWSNVAHYPYMVRAIGRRIFLQNGKKEDMITTGSKTSEPRNLSNTLRRLFVPNRDGEMGNALTEIWYFSRWRWSGLFRRNDWKIEGRKSNRLLYTAYYIFGTGLSIKARSLASRLLGGLCHVYVLRPSSADKA